MFHLTILILIIPSCKKEYNINIPISLTDINGNIFIPIDTVTSTFDAYSNIKFLKGKLTGVFNDTIHYSFYLALKTNVFWDSTYHPIDTLVFPTHYTGLNRIIKEEVDLHTYTSPYHFILIGLSKSKLKSGSLGKPSITLTLENSNN